MFNCWKIDDNFFSNFSDYFFWKWKVFRFCVTNFFNDVILVLSKHIEIKWNNYCQFWYYHSTQCFLCAKTSILISANEWSWWKFVPFSTLFQNVNNVKSTTIEESHPMLHNASYSLLLQCDESKMRRETSTTFVSSLYFFSLVNRRKIFSATSHHHQFRFNLVNKRMFLSHNSSSCGRVYFW